MIKVLKILELILTAKVSGLMCLKAPDSWVLVFLFGVLTQEPMVETRAVPVVSQLGLGKHSLLGNFLSSECLKIKCCYCSTRHNLLLY